MESQDGLLQPQQQASTITMPRQSRRTRARVACTQCNKRKVRCDVTLRGTPCTNCHIDHKDCSLQQSKSSRSSKVGDPKLRAEPSAPPSNALVQKTCATPPHFMPTEDSLSRTPNHVIASSSSAAQSPGVINTLWKDNGFLFKTHALPSSYILRALPDTASEEVRTDSNAVFSSCGFLETGELSNLPPEDVKFLDMKGCMCVPSGPTLDAFVQQYFLHVHPYLPILNEAEFWQMYHPQGEGSNKTCTLSLFTFQAMLFASCPFVSAHFIKKSGFSDFRNARKILYQRAKVSISAIIQIHVKLSGFSHIKLLYDFNVENHCLAKAQGSLLLTYQSASIDLHTGVVWLTNAIHNAMLVGAHLYEKETQDSPLRMVKKRLWWCCILRDRIIPLGLRRHLLITPGNFDLAMDTLSEEDLEDEICNSEVYDVETKRNLVKVFKCLCRLAMALTDLIMIAYPTSRISPPEFDAEEALSQMLVNIREAKNKLLQWAETAKITFDPIYESDDAHESVTLYSDLTYVYYHAAKVAMCHHEALVIEINQKYLTGNYVQRLQGIKNELKDATQSITKNVKHLVMCGLARHLPISAVPYTAFPLLLNAFDLKVASENSQVATTKRRLSYYTELMRLYHHRYEGSDNVARFIQQILHVASRPLNLLPSTTDHGSQNDLRDSNSKAELAIRRQTRSWSDIFVNNPRFYLSLSLSLDFAFSRGQFPQDNDLPELFRELQLTGESYSSPERNKSPGGSYTQEQNGSYNPDFDTQFATGVESIPFAFGRGFDAGELIADDPEIIGWVDTELTPPVQESADCPVSLDFMDQLASPTMTWPDEGGMFSSNSMWADGTPEELFNGVPA